MADDVMRALESIQDGVDGLEGRCRESDRRTERLHAENRRSLEELGRDIRSLASSIKQQGNPIRGESALWIGIGILLGRLGWAGADQALKLIGAGQ